MGLFNEIFTWWNGNTWGTRYFTMRKGKLVGEDEFGNRYYLQRKGLGRWVFPVDGLHITDWPKPRPSPLTGMAGSTTQLTNCQTRKIISLDTGKSDILRTIQEPTRPITLQAPFNQEPRQALPNRHGNMNHGNPNSFSPHMFDIECKMTAF